ncbi:MAG: hypothetical protein SPLUMA2_SPLUMAMAG2_01652 [uncultured Sulfurimonas sp.]|nr:MAG: hypothetical protein SPLUMA2_SPLUMAMAG2_01652 [uncultured Sulfurimonas sp.]
MKIRIFSNIAFIVLRTTISETKKIDVNPVHIPSGGHYTALIS